MKSNKFSLSHSKLLSCDLGELVPVGLVEVLPGDRFRHSTVALLRCAPLLAPIMHAVDVRIHHFFVPHRLVWVDFEKFITGGADGLDASVFPTVTVPGGGFAVGSLADYLGVPPSVGAGQTVSALPFRGYAMIFNEWYRDQDLVSLLALSTASGADSTTSVALQNCGWEKDYFTSARPWEQKGAAVTIPITGQAPIEGLGFVDGTATATINNVRYTDATVANRVGQLSGTGQVFMKTLLAAGNNVGASNPPQVFANMAAVTGVSVNSLRQSLAIQRYQEAAARYGSRYPEYLARLGVRSSDGRLQRPEYLGGGRQKIQFSEVVQTGPGADPVGDLKGHGIAALRSNRYQRFFEEHGYVFTLLSVRPKTVYANGLMRTWNRRTKFDFWQKEFEHVGQQPIANKEVYMAHGTPDGVFGYQDRYDEYRRMESSIAGEFRTTTLDFWHMARIFSSSPALNSTFVTSVPTERGFAVPAEDVLQINCKHSIQARRLLTRTGTSFIF